MSRMKFLNIEIDNLYMDEALLKVDEFLSETGFHYLVTPNVDHIVQVESNQNLKNAYDSASLILTDGKPLIWVSKLLNKTIKEKISGSDFFPAVAELSAKRNYKLFLLGAAEGVAEKAKENMESKYENLNIVGTYSPPFGFEKNNIEMNKIVNLINSSGADILAVGLGAPKQELFLYESLKKQTINAKFAMGIGASIDFEAGVIKRAPKWMQNSGLEWLYRLIKEPRRLYKRYLKDFILFIPLLIKYRNE